jgi:hypothetical protein
MAFWEPGIMIHGSIYINQGKRSRANKSTKYISHETKRYLELELSLSEIIHKVLLIEIHIFEARTTKIRLGAQRTDKICERRHKRRKLQGITT